MNVEDTSKEIMPLFQKYWNKSVAKVAGTDPKIAFTGNASYTKTLPSASVNITAQKNRKKASIVPAICKAFGPTFLFGVLLKLVQDILSFVPPQLLSLIIKFVGKKKEPEPLWHGICYAVLLFLISAVQTLFLAQYFQRMFLVALRIRTAIIGAVYKKAMMLSNSARKESTVGEIVNLMAVDAQRFMDLTAYINMIWSAPLQICLALYFLWGILGPSVLAGKQLL